MLLEVLHRHRGQIKEFVGDFEGTAEVWGVPDVDQDALHLVQNLEIIFDFFTFDASISRLN